MDIRTIYREYKTNCGPHYISIDGGKTVLCGRMPQFGRVGSYNSYGLEAVANFHDTCKVCSKKALEIVEKGGK